MSLSLLHTIQNHLCLKGLLLTTDLIGIWWDLCCSLGIQNAFVTDTAEEEGFRVMWMEQTSKMILNWDFYYNPIKHWWYLGRSFLMKTIMKVWSQVWIPNLSVLGGLDFVVLLQTRLREIWKHFLKYVFISSSVSQGKALPLEGNKVIFVFNTVHNRLINFQCIETGFFSGIPFNVWKSY